MIEECDLHVVSLSNPCDRHVVLILNPCEFHGDGKLVKITEEDLANAADSASQKLLLALTSATDISK